MELHSEHTLGSAAAKLYTGDALNLLTSLPADSVDLVITSPPYFVGKAYDTSRSLSDFKAEINRVSPEIKRVVKTGGNICWQVGIHVEKSRITPLDAVMVGIFSEDADLNLKNRIVWTFGHGAHAANRLSGRHETILWYTKGAVPFFNLDAIRVPQKYPGKRHYKGPNKGQWSGNPLGKNPGDVWDIPNVKACHVEKTEHPCQFPLALINRLVLSMSPSGGVVLDPYMGSGTVGVSALMNGRSFQGVDMVEKYVSVASGRLNELKAGRTKFRDDKPVLTPNPQSAVAKLPDHFRIALEVCSRSKRSRRQRLRKRGYLYL